MDRDSAHVCHIQFGRGAMMIWVFIIGFIVGGLFGIAIMGICVISGQEDERRR
jgi:hypothetical protein